jgi:hypothetical protein
MGAALPKALEVGSLGQSDGVPILLFSHPPAV